MKTKTMSIGQFEQRARVGQAEFEALKLIAQVEQLNLSEAARLCLRESAKARGLWPPRMMEEQNVTNAA